MDILGISANWLSVAGLFADMAGVGILAWDLFPEYRLFKARRFLASARENAKEYVALCNVPSERSPDEPFAAERAEHHRFRLRNSLLMARADILMATSYLRLEPEKSAWRAENPSEQLFKRISALEMEEGQRRLAASDVRAPIGFGVFLILVGFALQIVGSLPF